ncbi:MAG TPA: methyltransferase [Amnibacterium sp.]|jgi:16S rRNA G1207 methylase RsmC|uniref:class I SAM-dependent methyltransferase n=1 Tax=Amnibacterium sp. TaxID=1872496 RepID=UPI002F95796C
MADEHYFSAQPSSEERPRTIRVTLAGKDLELRTQGGVFSPERLDSGTAVLLSRVPAPPTAGAVLDLGCGWGPIAIAMKLRSPQADVWAVDVNERALALAADNARIAGISIKSASPQDIPDDLRFATIWSNPPIRIGKPALHALLEQWLPRLEPGASAWLVVAKQLGGDSLQDWIAERFAADGLTVRRAATDRGYRVLEVRSGPGHSPE